MSVRVGLSFGGFPFSSPTGFWRWVDACEESAVDSIWLSDRIVSTTPVLEPLSALAAIAGRTRRLKLGTDVVVLPTRDPVLLAKQCATIDYLSAGRFLPAFGIGSDPAPEWAALGVRTRGRGARANEMLQLMARLWTEDDVSFAGKYFQCEHVSINPKPQQAPLPVWIGGASAAAVERTARYGHGWIGGSVSLPQRTGEVIAAIRAKAAELGRSIEPDHYGAGVSFRFGSWEEPIVTRTVESLAGRTGGAAPSSFLGVGDAEAIIAVINAFQAVGVSKFVLRPLAASDAEMIEQTQRLSREVLPYVHT
jgi:probable F420-dependent oxidoreductase